MKGDDKRQGDCSAPSCGLFLSLAVPVTSSRSLFVLFRSCGPLTTGMPSWPVHLPPNTGGARTGINSGHATTTPPPPAGNTTGRQTSKRIATCHLHAAHRTQGTPMHWTQGLALLARAGEPCIPSMSLPGRLHALDRHAWQTRACFSLGCQPCLTTSRLGSLFPGVGSHAEIVWMESRQRLGRLGWRFHQKPAGRIV